MSIPASSPPISQAVTPRPAASLAPQPAVPTTTPSLPYDGFTCAALEGKEKPVCGFPEEIAKARVNDTKLPNLVQMTGGAAVTIVLVIAFFASL